MTAAYVTMRGKLMKDDNTYEEVSFVGMADIISMHPGSPPPRPHPEPPLGIWGPNDPRPTPPIPIYPGGTPNPPGIWGPPGPWIGWWVPGAPGAPGYEPPKPDEPPPFEVKVGWTAETGWVVVLVPTGEHVVPST